MIKLCEFAIPGKEYKKIMSSRTNAAFFMNVDITIQQKKKQSFVLDMK